MCEDAGEPSAAVACGIDSSLAADGDDRRGPVSSSAIRRTCSILRINGVAPLMSPPMPMVGVLTASRAPWPSAW